eukprot:gnl/MRDRNA2_/MRDRNA2_81569_c0_seq3.p1 gnl/MRDRNA2_/MRDRNA2_81569_c0~~gnl/MRDRNA2_/MRDRNA2_81569_c0_seq3.p1  ORF type:complete len:100 (-),score=4.66 gnl/MRDRNA2_/MRDRNA2_81569_c0_seq3:56-355(-)
MISCPHDLIPLSNKVFPFLNHFQINWLPVQIFPRKFDFLSTDKNSFPNELICFPNDSVSFVKSIDFVATTIPSQLISFPNHSISFPSQFQITCFRFRIT